MKNRLLPLFVILGTVSAYSQVGVGTLNPKSSAQLEVFSNNKGVLIPQIALTSITDNKTIVNGNIVSLLVYNTTDNSSITPGYYYWFDNRWNRMLISGDLTTIAGNSTPVAKGEPGYPGENTSIYIDKSNSTVYVQNSDGTWSPITGNEGKPGKDGADGKSAFEIWKELPGNDGKTITEYAAGIKGETGADGKSAFEIWKELPGNDGKDMNEYVAGLTGATGADGKSAFEIWKELPGNDGKDLNEYVAGLKGETGADGKSAFEIWKELPGNDGKDLNEYVAGLTGATGADGKSAFEIWKELPGNDGKDMNEYVAGQKGETGADGKSAFEIWKELPGNDGKTITEYAAGIKGETGADGKPGEQGPAGIGGKTNQGTNITITGAGTEVSPYVVNAIIPQQAIDEFTANAGQTSFTLAATPSNLSKVKLYINGVRIDKDALTVTDNILTYKPASNGSYILMVNDNVMIDYLK